MCSRDVCSQIISVDRLGLTLLYAIARDFFLMYLFTLVWGSGGGVSCLP